MATLTRQIIGELVGVLIVWLSASTAFFVFCLVAMEVRTGGVNAAILLRLIPFILPQALVFAVPATTLLSVCIVYGRLAAANEVVAVKSLGIPPWSIAWPAYALALVLSVICLWLNEIATSWGEVGARRVIIQSVEEIVYGTLRTQRSYSNKQISIIVSHVDEHRLIQPVISFHGELSYTITADEAELSSNLENNTLVLTLTNCIIDGGGSLQGEFPGRVAREIPLSQVSDKGELVVNVTQLSFRDIFPEIDRQRQRIKRLKQQLASDASFSLISGDILDLNEPNWKVKRQKLKEETLRLYKLQTEPWRRSSMGAMCFFFTLVGVPLAIQLRNSDYWTTFAVAFAPVFLYFVLFFSAFLAAKAGQVHPVLLWTSNAIWAFAGWRLWQKVERY